VGNLEKDHFASNMLDYVVSALKSGNEAGLGGLRGFEVIGEVIQ
jgi:hypothetical protein